MINFDESSLRVVNIIIKSHENRRLPHPPEDLH